MRWARSQVFALNKKKPKGKEGTTRACRRRAATNVIRPGTAPLAVGLWSSIGETLGDFIT